MRTRARVSAVALGASLLLGTPCLAGDDYGYGVMRQSREDARDLSLLAPPARRSTATATYGDAPLARTQGSRRRHIASREFGADAPVGLYFCRSRTTRALDRLCARDPRRVGFRDFYLYTPAYATAPQVPRDGLGREHSLLPPATAFFYSANERLFGNPPGE